ncbi:MAG TPA: DnaJ domain-containing protein [Candidatus Binatia bacterium]|nr:DnaJ domain-containing protein [Candidatus Binatia bacterium]
MAIKDYYLILGVSRRESPRGIQDAFRELAKRYHPDRAGPEGSQQFQVIREAYETLSDPEKRKLYNHQIEREEVSLSSRPEPIFTRPYPRPEPLIPEPRSVLRDFETIQPSFEPLFERFVRNFTGLGIPKGERLEDLNVEVVLSPEEAAQGIAVPLNIPLFRTCLQCGGSGRDWLFVCVECNGQGIIEEERTVRIPIPPRVGDRTVIEVPIHGLGIRNFYLRIHIRISP